MPKVSERTPQAGKRRAPRPSRSLGAGRLREKLAALPDPLGFLEGLFLHSPVPHAVFNKAGRCVLTNPAYRAMFGRPPPARYNVFRDEVLQRQGVAELLHRAFLGETIQVPVFWYEPKELRHVHATDAQRAAFSCTLFPLMGPDGEASHVAITYKNVTAELALRDDAASERERAAKALRESQARLHVALESAQVGTWRVELGTGRAEWDANLGAILGFAATESVRHLHSFYERIHPEDRERVVAWAEAIMRGQDLEAEMVYRVVRTDGTVRWVKDRGQIISSGEGEGAPRYVTGAMVDVTDLKRAERRLRALANTSTALGQATTDFSAALQALARLASETLGECCVLTLLDEGRRTLSVEAAYHPELEAQRLMKDTLYGLYEDPDGTVMRVIRTGQPQLLAQVPQEGLLASLTPAVRLFVERFGLHSFLLVPLRAQGQVIGTLGVSRGRPGNPYTEEDGVFLQEMADRAGLVIQNVRLLKAAQAAVRLRDDFLSVASHELKTPLTTMNLKLQALARAASPGHEEGLAERLARDVESMRRQVRRLSDLVSDLLDVARISGGRMKLELELVDLAALVREVSSRFELEAERAGCPLTVSAEGSLLGHWDRLRLEQVVTNLLSNALKYGACKPISVRLEAGEAQARLRIRDQGIGIEPGQLARIFGKFERAVSERHYGGLGLGLYITRQIIDALGGSIEVESQPGQGATFTVTLPLESPQPKCP